MLLNSHIFGLCNVPCRDLRSSAVHLGDFPRRGDRILKDTEYIGSALGMRRARAGQIFP